MYICYMAYRQPVPGLSTYWLILAWLAAVYIIAFSIYRLIIRSRLAVRLGLFILGGLFWIFSTLMLYQSENTWSVGIWSVSWAVGLAAMFAVLTRLRDDMKLVAGLAEEEIPAETREQVQLSSNMISYLAFTAASILMLFMLTLWSFLNRSQQQEWIRSFRVILMIFPFILMQIGIGYAMRQPLDNQNRLRLLHFTGGRRPVSQRDRLRQLLVSKYRKRFGIKILISVIRPFWHHKVYGRENIDPEEFPSVFVCNHGEIYGPVTALLYLPTYFRPWANSVLLDRETAITSMSTRLFARIPFLSLKVRRALAIALASPLLWAIYSFDPIPVYKNKNGNIMDTMLETLKVMEENDNILIFPENPHAHEGDHYADDHVGEFYTGFAHLGHMYYEKTQKCLAFYPIFSNKAKRTFTIGRPVHYQPGNHPRKERIRIAMELHGALVDLAGGKG
jgi:hypothetical protein